MFCGSFVTTIVWFIVIVFHVPYYLLYLLFLLEVFAYTAKCLSFASICETMPLKMSGVSIAFVNAVVMSLALYFAYYWSLIDYHSNGQTVRDIPCYNGEDYRFALVIVPVSPNFFYYHFLYERNSS